MIAVLSLLLIVRLVELYYQIKSYMWMKHYPIDSLSTRIKGDMFIAISLNIALCVFLCLGIFFGLLQISIGG